ncbi:MAG TPA: tyrosine-type recombinase/integrase [Aequorivita sp.]|nr:tyrosine-type recombinase/integrase [Aequorivita sp.]
MKTPIYSEPKLCKSSKGWYIHFRYAGVQKRYKFGLNRIRKLADKEREFNLLRRAFKKKLQEGWNPLLPEFENENEQMSLADALAFALDKKKDSISTATYSAYKSAVNFYTDAIKSMHFNYLTVSETKRAHIRRLANEVKLKRKWSNKAHNKYLGHIKSVLSVLVDWDIIERNPAHLIKQLPEEDSNANVPASPEEHQTIKEHLENSHPHFYVYVATIFHTGIRPKEVLGITLRMVDLNKRQIILPANITKTKKERIVPINDHLLSMLYDMDLDGFPLDFFLFGSYREPGQGNRSKSNLDFVPGPTRIRRNTASMKWKKIVKDGLRIDVNLYSNKHAGANAKILAGIDLDALRELYGHSSKLMTMRYAKAVKEVYRKQIMEKSPEF